MKKILAIGIVGIFLMLVFNSSLTAIGFKENRYCSISSGDISITDIDFVDSITLYNSQTEQPQPIDNHAYAAYIKDSNVKVKAKFASSVFSGQEINIRATGSLGGLSSKKVKFNGADSDWITFEAQNTLPNSISVNAVDWEWQYEESGTYYTITTSSHEIYALNKEPLGDIVWLDLAQWTTEWCSGASDNAKTIADRILNGFVEDEVVRYGLDIRDYPGSDSIEKQSTHNILHYGGGMCLGLSNLFYDACGTQGIKAYRFWFILQDSLGNEFDGILCLSPGLGRSWSDPEEPYQSEYRNWRFVDNVGYTDQGTVIIHYYGDDNPDDSVDDNPTNAYYFTQGDGHAVNLIENNGKYDLYDLSFGGSYSAVFNKFPKTGTPSSDVMNTFRKKYHDIAVDYMRGDFPYFNEFGEWLDGLDFSIKSSSITYEQKLPYTFRVVDRKGSISRPRIIDFLKEKPFLSILVLLLEIFKSRTLFETTLGIEN